MANEKNLAEGTSKVVTEGVPENTGADVTAQEEPEDVVGEETEDESGDDSSRVLVAVYPILFHSHQYQIGDELPANYPDMVDAWIEAGTAVWRKTEDSAPKAIPATAEPGLSGNAVTSDSEGEEDLVGKVPRTVRRSKK